MNDDHLIATLVREAGFDATSAAVADIRAVLADELAAPGRHRVATAEERAAGRRPSTRWLGIAAACAVAVGAGIVATDRGGDDGQLRTSTPGAIDPGPGAPGDDPSTLGDDPTDPGDNPTDTGVSDSAVTPPVDTATAAAGAFDPASVDDTTWVLVEVDGEPWTSTAVPGVRFEADDGDDGVRILAWDGCNSGSGRLDANGDIVDYGSTLIGCPDAGFVSMNGRAARAGDTLTISSPAAVLRFARLGAENRVGVSELLGRWELEASTGDEPHVVTIGDRGGMGLAVGRCFIELRSTLDGLVFGTRAAGIDGCDPDPAVGGFLARIAVAWDGDPQFATEGAPVPAHVIGEVLYLVPGDGVGAIRLRRQPEVPVDPAGVTLDRGALFGQVPGAHPGDDRDALVDELTAAATAQLGPATFDTGWSTTATPAPEDGPDCLGGVTMRTVWWGDVSMSFIAGNGFVSLWTWSVGDPYASGWGDRRSTSPGPSDADSALRTERGIGVGSTLAELEAAYGARFTATEMDVGDGGTWYLSNPVEWPYFDGTSFVGVVVRDGLVAGYAATLSFC